MILICILRYFDFARSSSYLRWIRVDDADVLRAVRPLQDHLLHVGADHGHARRAEFVVDEPEEFRYVAHELLADALAGRVDGELEGWGGVEHGRGEHGNRDGLAESARMDMYLSEQIE